ncbi:MAG: hypothetical protein MJ151_04310, partial [Lachnospiraceae bacterium]|nr:hypothetical protein [Lachnospiraceae bacterium]
MKLKHKKQKNIFLYTLLSISFLCAVISYTSIYTYSATIYQNDIKDDVSDKNIGMRQHAPYDRSTIRPTVEEATKKPTKEPAIDPNILYTTRKDWEKEKKNIHGIIIQKETVTPSEATNEYNPSQKYTYIRHRNGISTVSGEYLWEDYVGDDKMTHTRLLIHHSDDEPGLAHYAYSGFYKIGDDTYCFDKNGHLIKGMAKAEYDIIYEFDSESGKLLK